MFLKSLTLKGFKSFADTTTLEFEPGVTVVVGPNGSGKSNIVDAVAWVLGAQGPRTLRSTRMEDVIFAGTPGRPALGRAEVSLTIDNQAGLLPIDFSEVTVTRTLFRSGDSEYAINGVPCRLLDVQELLSDTGVGRQQHVIVSQGQLDAVLNARSEDRRLVIEEAAGILKYRRRKERAERRLASTESSVLRLQDLLREVRRQLRPLERQAEGARRHGDLVEELRAVRGYLAGRELAAVEGRLAVGSRTRAELGGADEALRGALRRLDEGIAEAEAELSKARRQAQGTDLGDALSRAEGLRATARGLAAVIAERRRSIERDRTASIDHDVVSSLEAESARMASELAAVEAEALRVAPASRELDDAEAALEAETRALEEHGADRTATPDRAAAEVRGELTALRIGLERGGAEMHRLDTRLEALHQRLRTLDEDGDHLRDVIRQADEAEPPLVASLERARGGRREAESALETAENACRLAEAEHHRWSARVEALALAPADARARAGAESLLGCDGVVGPLLELVEVDPGWETAFEAAADEAVAAVVVSDVEAARRSLEILRHLDASGAVVALADPGAGASAAARGPGVGTGRAAFLGRPPGDQPLRVPGHEPIRAHVRARMPGVERLLDRLLDNAVAVTGDWVEALDLALMAPHLMVVTRDGDRFTRTAWRTGASSSWSSGAALEEARRRAADAANASERRSAAAAEARAEVDGANLAETQLARRLDANEAQRAAASDALQRIDAQRRDVMTERDAQSGHQAELAERLDREAHRMAELEGLLPTLEEATLATAARAVAQRAARARLADRAAAVNMLRRDVEVRAAGLEGHRTLLTRRLGEIEARLRHHADERNEATVRRVRLDRDAAAIERLAQLVDARSPQLDTVVAELRQARHAEAAVTARVAERLEQLRRERVTAERQLAETRERVARIELDETEARVRLETLVEAIRRDLDCEPEATRDAECPPMPPGSSPSSRVRELERELRLMGPVNPLALEEYTALQERHRFLESQLEDVRSARRELAKVIRAVDAEIIEVFRAAYADVADNFETLFTTLFPGGQGRIRLTDPDHLLETGIEVEARPSGKNVRRLSLLSGGERSLTALAFLFSVFRSRPSPFYLLDEVEAALDDVNLHRFLELLHEFRDEAQLVVVSHQKRTMEAADCLYGVTMQPGGSSRVVSERVSTRT